MSPVCPKGSLKRSSESELGAERLVSSWGYREARALGFFSVGVERRLKENSAEILSRMKV